MIFLPNQNENSIPLANMDVVAKQVGTTHHSINGLIRKHESTLKISHPVIFEKAPGRSHKKNYFLSWSQFVFITERMNNKKAIRLQKRVANAFENIEHIQTERRVTHDITKDSTKELEQAIHDNLRPKSNNNLYRNFKRLIYKLALNKSVTQLKKERGATGNKREFLTTDELRAVEKIQHEMTLLISLGNDYHQVRDILNEKYRITYNVPVKKMINQ